MNIFNEPPAQIILLCLWCLLLLLAIIGGKDK